MNSNFPISTKLTRRRREEGRQVRVGLAWLLVRRKGHMTGGISGDFNPELNNRLSRESYQIVQLRWGRKLIRRDG